ncbi:MAG: 30S ribosomal protein S12 methylthiotransferase RimO [Chloroflexi bacterium]|nr:30S ribosomal protein S12 methylthiotransferase RimO [Chloroflexota bacterium]
MRCHLVTLGCAKNLADSEGIGVLLTEAGHHLVETPDRAEVIIVNTCGFLQPAREEAISVLRELSAGKEAGQLLVAAGCMIEGYADQLQQAVSGLDGLIGTRQWTEMPNFLAELARRKPEDRWQPYVRPPSERNHVADSVSRQAQGTTAYLKIADGCSAPCAFCTIPAIKGSQRSKPPRHVLAEARQLAEQGVQEIVLVAQDLTAYGRDRGEKDALPPLLDALVEAVPTVPWIRLLYAYPGHVSDRLIETIAQHEQICNYLDMPLQHASESVLKRMRRPHNMERVRRFYESLRRTVPDVALRTTFIVGYPGETETEFQELLDFMAEVRFDRVGIFPYSQEPGTPAADLAGQVPDEIKQERHERAMLWQQSISLSRNQEQVGRVYLVLVDGAGDGISLCRSYRDAPEVDGFVVVEGTLPLGQFVRVRIAGAMEYDLLGEPEARAAGG